MAYPLFIRLTCVEWAHHKEPHKSRTQSRMQDSEAESVNPGRVLLDSMGNVAALLVRGGT